MQQVRIALCAIFATSSQANVHPLIQTMHLHSQLVVVKYMSVTSNYFDHLTTLVQIGLVVAILF